jgi:hypothetical protein
MKKKATYITINVNKLSEFIQKLDEDKKDITKKPKQK